jgi:hypothetical protein
MTARCLFTFILMFFSQEVLCQDFGPVKQGILDLREWNFAEQPVISIDGEWEFHWNKLVRLKDLLGNEVRTFAQLSVPWNEQLIHGKSLPKDGCATYVLRILMPEMDSVAFAVPAVYNSYAFWVNDKLICKSGQVGTSAATMIPQWRPETVSVASPGDTLYVIFQIANFQQTRGGCSEQMRIGTTSYLQGLNATYQISGITLIVLFMMASIAGFIIYFIFRPMGFLFLASLSLAYTIRFLFSDLYFYYDLGLNIPWQWAARIEYNTMPLIIICAALFMATIYPQEFKRSILYFFVSVNALLLVVIIFCPSSLFSPLVLMLQIIGLALVMYSIYTILKALIFQRKGAWVSALGTGVFALIGFYNIYVFIMMGDLNRTFIHSGYAVALLLNVISLLYRTPVRLRHEEQDTLRFSDLYSEPIIKV